jgi:hypothetical protein
MTKSNRIQAGCFALRAEWLTGCPGTEISQPGDAPATPLARRMESRSRMTAQEDGPGPAKILGRS